MRRIRTVLAIAALTLPAFAQAAPDQAEAPFRNIFDAFLAAMWTHNFPAVTSLVNAQSRRLITTQIRPSQHAAFFANATTTMPHNYEVEYVTVARSGLKASMILVGMVAVSPEDQKAKGLPPEQKSELTVEFDKEAGLWKVGTILYGDNPDLRPRPKDLLIGQRGDYSAETSTDMGGVILRFEKQTEGTVYVIRVIDEEDAVFVPADKVLPAFVPGAILSCHAAQNQKDKLKYWAESAEVVE